MSCSNANSVFATKPIFAKKQKMKKDDSSMKEKELCAAIKATSGIRTNNQQSTGEVCRPRGALRTFQSYWRFNKETPIHLRLTKAGP